MPAMVAERRGYGAVVRVVAGSARGRRLEVPKGTDTRPTTDRVRESMFNALGSLDVVDGARVLDLFAGSGALGVEALSRGAAHVTFVEPDRAARACVEANLRAAGFTSDATVVAQRAEAWLDAHRPDGPTRFDVALLDPPYAFDGWDDLLPSLPAAFAVIESNREVEPPADWEVVRSRRYGTTFVTFARRTSNGTTSTSERP